MNIKNMSLSQCVELLFASAESTKEYWDDRAADEYRNFMDSLKTELKECIERIANEG